MDQVQKSKSARSSSKTPVKRINETENGLLKDNRKLVAESEELRKKLKKAEERVRNMEKLFRDSNKKLSPKEIKVLINKTVHN